MLYLFLSSAALAIVFVFFLVITRTLGTIINYLTKIEYWILQEAEFKKEQDEIRKALESDEAQQADAPPAEPAPDPFAALQMLQQMNKGKGKD